MSKAVGKKKECGFVGLNSDLLLFGVNRIAYLQLVFDIFKFN